MLTLLTLALAAPQSFSFSSPSPVTHVSSRDGEILPIDADGDGIDDLLVYDEIANFTSPNLQETGPRLRLFRSRGDGTFDDPVVLLDPFYGPTFLGAPLGVRVGQFRSVDVLDLDGDGLDDVALSNADADGSAQFWWLRNEGSAFARPESLSIASYSSDAAIADMDGDGILDLVCRSSLPGPGSATQVVFAPGQGNTTFGAPVRVSALQNHRVIDFDADGDADVIGTRLGRMGFSLNDVQGGVFSFVVSDFDADRFDVGDLDGDGLPDVAILRGISNPDTAILEWARNDGAGALLAPVLIANPGRASEIRLADIDGDGTLDVVTLTEGNARGAVWRNLGGGAFSGPAFMPEETRATGSLALGDFDGDAAIDVSFFGPSDPTGRRNESWPFWCRNRDTGGTNPLFAPGVEVRPFFRVLVEPADPEGAWTLRAADVDVDGDLDLLYGYSGGFFTTRGTWLLRASADSRFAVERLPTPELLKDFTVGDINADGAPEIVGIPRFGGTGLRIVENDGSGTFSVGPRVTSIPGVPSSQIIARETGPIVDVDGDGHSDLTWVIGLSRSGGSIIGFVAGDGTGQFGEAQLLVQRAGQLSSPEFADINADGWLDVVYLIYSNVEVLFGTGPGTFASSPVLVPFGSVPFRADEFLLEDLDGNGTLDIFGTAQSVLGAPLRWVPTLPGGGFGAGVVVGNVELGRLGGFADLDSDGDRDLLVFDRDGLLAYDRDGAAGFAAPERVVTSPEALRVNATLGDFDGDLDVDVVYFRERQRELVLARNEALGEVGAAYCGPAVPNSTGFVGEASIGGSPAAGANEIRLRASHLPPSQLTVFLASRDAAIVAQPGGSEGVLCLGGSIGRFNRPGELLDSGPSGQAFLAIDLDDLPVPTGSMSATAGETWFFQAWHRDLMGGTATSNFTNGVQVTWQ